MRLAELLADLELGDNAYVGCDPQTRVNALCVDSREVSTKLGCAFLATRGASIDAHRFVDAALRSGAVVALVERGHVEAPAGPHVWLDDPTAAYAQIAANRFARPAESLKLAAVTGTNGKTTTAHLLEAVLRHAGHGTTRLGTTGNWVVDREETATFTTPFPLELQGLLRRSLDRGGTHVVMEASSHALAQGRVDPLRFDAVGFTSFSQDHLDFHPTMEAYLQAKCLLAGRYLADDGVAVAAVDDQPAALQFLQAAGPRRTIHVSRGDTPNAEIFVQRVHYESARTVAIVRTPDGTVELNTPLIAPFNLDNALVCLGMALALGVSLDNILAALHQATGAPGRLQRVEVEGHQGPTVVVDYAHTPDAVARALAAVRPLCQGKVHVVLGCGGDRDPSKRPLMGEAAAHGSDVFWATSDNPRSEAPQSIVDQMLAGLSATNAAVHREVDRGCAIRRAVGEAKPDDLVLIAGKGHESYQILANETIDFDDREHARAALTAR